MKTLLLYILFAFLGQQTIDNGQQTLSTVMEVEDAHPCASTGDSVTYYESQIRLADSLYKNYLPQYNFDEVKEAVAFFERTTDNSQQTTDFVHVLMSTDNSQQTTDLIHSKKSQQLRNSTSQQLSNSTSQQLSNSTSQQLSNSASQQLSNSASQQLSNSTSQQLSNSASQQLSNSTSQQLSNSASQQLRNSTSCAKAHYYHAVGLTERDDIVGACEHYLRALEIMEPLVETSLPWRLTTNDKRLTTNDKSLKSKEKSSTAKSYKPKVKKNKTVDRCPLSVDNPQDYEKLRFLALIYNRLGRLFYNENYCDLAITKYRKALRYFEILDDNNSKANVLKELGNSYQLANKPDSALYYYNGSLRYNSSLPNKLDVEKSIAQILFYKGDKDTAYSLIRNNMSNINDINVRYSYYSVLGEFYFNDQKYDSAIYYYEKNTHSNIYYIMLSSYSELSNIYKIIGSYENESYYNNKISNLLVHKLNNEVNKSKILTIYNDYKKIKLDRETKNKQEIIRKTILRIVITFVCALFVIFMVTVFMHKKNKRQFYDKLKKMQIEINENKREISVIESELLTKQSEVDILLESIKEKENNLIQLSKQIEEKDVFILGLKFKHSLIDGKIKSKNSELKEKEILITQYITEINELKNKLTRHTSNATNLQEYFQSDICLKILNQISDLSIGNLDTSLLNPLSQEEFVILLKSANYCLNGLMDNISKKYPKLKKEDLYFLCLVIINLNNKQISNLFGVSYTAITKRRNKIYTTMELDTSENLHNVILKLI